MKDGERSVGKLGKVKKKETKRRERKKKEEVGRKDISYEGRKRKGNMPSF